MEDEIAGNVVLKNAIFHKKERTFEWSGESWNLLRIFNDKFEISDSEKTSRSMYIKKEDAQYILSKNHMQHIEYGFWSIQPLEKNECCTSCAVQYPFSQLTFDRYLTNEYADFICQNCEESSYSNMEKIYCKQYSFERRMQFFSENSKCQQNGIRKPRWNRNSRKYSQ